MNDFVLTFDLDWAPDFMIEEIASWMRDERVRSTWFVTHGCKALEKLRDAPDLFELGIHPNLLPGSTQGETPEKVLSHLLDIVPEARSVRFHGVVQSGPLLKFILTQTQIRMDSTLFLPNMTSIQPIEHQQFGKILLRIPFFWSDDYEMGKRIPQWEVTPHLQVQGLKVFNFHPVHVYLNSADDKPYQKLKQGIRDLTQVTPEKATPCFHEGKGTKTFFTGLLEHLAARGHSLRLCDVYDRWKSEQSRDGE
jgi:hypothetical protein